MNDKDKEAFEKWCTEKFNIAPELVEEFKNTFIHKLRHTEEAWHAAIEYERARSQKLIEALERIERLKDDTSAMGIADDALWDYKKEG